MLSKSAKRVAKMITHATGAISYAAPRRLLKIPGKGLLFARTGAISCQKYVAAAEPTALQIPSRSPGEQLAVKPTNLIVRTP